MNEMAKAPQAIAAFFDLDGTLLSKPSIERRFLNFLWLSGMLGVFAALRWLTRFARNILAWNAAGLEERWLAATDGNKAHLAGVSVTSADAFLARLAHEPFQFFSGALRRLAWHVAQDHAIYIVTGALGPLAVCAAWQITRKLLALTGGKKLRPEVCATQLEEANGRWTGKVAGEAICGEAKKRAIERVARDARIDLRRSYAYGDRLSDRWMLESVGNPAAVNPSRALEKVARKRGWAVLRWKEKEIEIQSKEDAEEKDSPTNANWGSGFVAAASSVGRRP